MAQVTMEQAKHNRRHHNSNSLTIFKQFASDYFTENKFLIDRRKDNGIQRI